LELQSESKRMKKIILFSIIAGALLFYSCSTDFNITAPYKETMVIYGLLNPDTTNNNMNKVQYIRISKAYLGEGNALIMAQQKDSINYADILDVTLQRIDVNGNVAQTFNLQRVDTNVKVPGIFYYPYEVLYKTTTTLNPVVANGSTYKLTVRNNQTGITATSLTSIVGDFDYQNPTTTSQANLDFTVPTLVDYKFNAADNARVYNLTIRFHYDEVKLSTNETTSKYVDWNLGDHATGGNENTIVYSGVYRPDLYRIVGASIVPADTNLIRRNIATLPLEFIFTAATEDLYTYQQIVQPSLGIVQERPLFTNIENGIGLFTSRYMKSLFKNLNAVSRAAFDTSAYTKNIHFH
jgi:hypothetical protein